MLETDSLVKVYRGRRVVDGVSLRVERGKIVGLLGPNGAGKTTTFYMMVGMVRPEAGEVLLEGERITNEPMYQRARKGLGYLSQEPSIFRKLTVRQNVMAVLETMSMSRNEREKRLDQLLEELGIGHLADQKAYTLSGGERRRLEISRALVTKPSFMLLDEPFSGIDPIAVTDIQDIVCELREKGLGVLVTDHNVRETLAITDHAYVMADGRILTEGTADFLANDPEARQIYLGERFSL